MSVVHTQYQSTVVCAPHAQQYWLWISTYDDVIEVNRGSDWSESIARGREIKFIFSLVPLREGNYPSYTPADTIVKYT